jgi:outer membrane protein assembly factor BamB
MKVKYIILIVAISVLLIYPVKAETDSSYQLVRELTPEEMQTPSVKADFNFSLPGSINVNLPSPMEKPEVRWIKKYDLFTSDRIAADTLGRTWHPYGDFTMFGSQKISCMEPDGSIAFEKTSEIGDICPVIVCKGALVFYTAFPFIFGADKEEFAPGISYVCLECLDLNGEMVWRTEKVKAGTFYKRVWRISKNRLIMAVDGDNSGRFNIYSLSDGKLLEQLAFPDWYAGTIEINPIELPDGGWIGYQKLAVLRFNKDLKTIWKYNVELKYPDVRTKFMTHQPVLSNNGVLLVGTQENLVALDIENGKELWRKNASARPYGITPKGHFIVSGGFLPEITMDDIRSLDTYEEIETAVKSKSKIAAIDTSGREIWSIPDHQSCNDYETGILVYQDENFLISTETNLLLISPVGSIIWSLNLVDFGIDDLSYGLDWDLKPVPDNRIVLTLSSSSTFKGPYIFSLGPVD